MAAGCPLLEMYIPNAGPEPLAAARRPALCRRLPPLCAPPGWALGRWRALTWCAERSAISHAGTAKSNWPSCPAAGCLSLLWMPPPRCQPPPPLLPATTTTDVCTPEAPHSLPARLHVQCVHLPEALWIASQEPQVYVHSCPSHASQRCTGAERPTSHVALSADLTPPPPCLLLQPLPTCTL